jgi:hypothetical protein
MGGIGTPAFLSLTLFEFFEKNIFIQNLYHLDAFGILPHLVFCH